MTVATGSQSTIAIGYPTEAPTSGTLDVTGDAGLTAATTLEMSIAQPGTGGGEPVPGTDYSQIAASGVVTLSNARFDVVLGVDNSGTCADLVPGQTYALVSASALNGVLDDSDGVPIANGETISLDNQCNDAAAPTVRINYTSTSVTATVVSSGHAGDVPGFGGGGSPSGPSISGTWVAGSPLEVSPGSSWTGNPTGFEYAWTSCSPDVNVGCMSVGTDSAQYTPTASDAGNTVEVCITPVNVYGTGYGVCAGDPTAITLPPAPTASTPPTLSGTAQVGGALTATAGSWTSSPSFSYQWQRCTTSQATACVNVDGATGSFYTLTSADAGDYVRVGVTATGLGGSTVAYSQTSGLVPAPTPNPTPTTTSTAATTEIQAPARPSTGQIRSALIGLAHPSDRKEANALLKSGFFRGTFHAPSGGSLNVAWTTVVRTGTGEHKKHSTVIVATGTAHPGASGTAQLVIRLTSRGRSLLEKKLTGDVITATDKFGPDGEDRVSVTERFTL